MSPAPVILFDGWALAYQPGSWESIHLLALLANLPPQIQAQVALPAEPFEPLPTGVAGLSRPTRNTPWNRLRWEQIVLPGLARSSQMDLLHMVGIRAALFASIPQVISPVGYDVPAELGAGGAQSDYRPSAPVTGLASRLRLALNLGGFSRAAGLIWPEDLPVPDLDLQIFKLPPLIHPGFERPAPAPALLELPETYILYHGPQTDADLHRLVETWSWATGSIGEYYPLLVLGFDPIGSAKMSFLLAQAGLSKTVSLLPPLPLDALAYLYQHCTAVFHPADISPWGGPLRAALRCGKPVVALETTLSDALVGPAGYLVKTDQAGVNRALGAALITVIVEEEVAANLAQAAQTRAAGWQGHLFSAALAQAYQVILSGG